MKYPLVGVPWLYYEQKTSQGTLRREHQHPLLYYIEVRKKERKGRKKMRTHYFVHIIFLHDDLAILFTWVYGHYRTILIGIVSSVISYDYYKSC